MTPVEDVTRAFTVCIF